MTTTAESPAKPAVESAWDGTIKGAPAVGAVAERSRRTSMADVELFTAMTGDRNPLHYDAALAAATPLGGLVVQGGVTTGILNALVAEDLPGPGTLFLGVEWRFLKAVKVGDTISGRVEVTGRRDDKPICTLKTTVRNQDGDVCLDGTATTYTLALAGAGGRHGKV